MKKIFAIVIAMAMVLSLVTVPAIAENRKVTPSTATMTLPRESTRDAANLNEALNVAGGNLNFVSEGTYPWVVDGDAAKSSNAGVSSSTSAVSTTVTAVEGDIVQFDFKAWGEGSSMLWDVCQFAVDGTVVFEKGAYDNEEFEAFAYGLTAGSHELVWSYTKDSSLNPYGDYFMVDNVYVGEPAMAESINVQDVTVPAGRRATVSYEVLPAAAYDKSVTFSIADTSIATVDANGVVTGVAEGTTTVTVTSAAVPTVSGTAAVTVTAALPDVNLEGYATYDMASSGLAGNWIGFADYDPATVSVLAPFDQQAWAGAFAGGNVYGYIYSESGSGHNFYIMDPETYTVSFTGTNADAVGGVIGMAYNHANQTMYGLSVNREIVTVDLATGVPTVVAPIDNENVLLLLAIDQEGNAYTMTSGGNLMALDLTNGSTAVIGATGLSANYVQSMTYDFETDMIYWAQVDASSYGLYAVNPQTAAAQSLGVIGPGGVEVVSMYIKNELEIDPIVMPDVTVTFVDSIDNAVIGTQTVQAGTVLDESTFPTPPTHDGYEFVGWDYNGAAVYTDLTVKARYRDPNATTATIILNLPADIWGDGTGYQMLLDADATAYGNIIPETGALTQGGDAPAGVYDEFEYKIPENADGSLTTQNIIITGQGSVEVPAGVYDWCITNPTPGDRVWIASSNGTIPGRYDDYEFVAGNTYTFTVTFGGQNDRVDLTIEDGGAPVDPTPTPGEPTPTPGESIIWDFETDPVAQGFTFLDQDGDGYNWYWHVNTGMGNYTAHSGDGVAASDSYDNDSSMALTPDNWMITPAFTGSSISFWMIAQDPSYSNDFVGVYVSTDGGNTWSEELFGQMTPTDYQQFTVNLSAYAGQTINVAFRHYNSSDMFIAVIDDIEAAGGAPVDPTPTPGEPTPVPPTNPPVDPTPTPGEPGEDLIAGYYFETEEEVNEWTFVDSDGDGNTWYWLAFGVNQEVANMAYEGVGNLTSASYLGAALTPDNWAISPAVAIPAGGASVSMYIGAQDPSWSDEHFAVYVGTGNDVSAYEMISDELVSTGAYARYEFDLSAYAGQTVSVAIRHFNCTDMFRINLDQVEFFGEGGAPVDPTPTPVDPTPVPGIIGDTNLDGQISTADAILALRHIMGLETLTGDALAQADVTGDGNVTIEDCILILRAALGLIEL